MLNENTVKEIIKSMLEGLQYLHRKRTIHRDVKPADVLLNHGQEDNGSITDLKVRLCDFRLIVEMPAGQDKVRDTPQV